jgi:16S rRNA (guanine966-N2)-methyltransferase
MRIIAGQYGGRTLAAPKTRDTRPMTDKVRAALFNILGAPEDAVVLDAYAGSGALGFEALSRGARQVVGVEKGRAAILAIKTNIVALELEWAYSLIPTSVENWLARRPEQPFDLIFAMPPYAILDPELLSRLGRLLTPEGTMVVEYPRQNTNYTVEGLALIDNRGYGDATICFYKPA